MFVFEVEVAVSVAVDVSSLTWAVVVCVVVLVTGAPPPGGVTVTMTVMTCVVGEGVEIKVEVTVVCDWVITETVLETHPISAHTNPGIQHPPPTLAGHAVDPSVHNPTVTPQLLPSGQQPTLPALGALVTTKHVVPVVQQ